MRTAVALRIAAASCLEPHMHADPLKPRNCDRLACAMPHRCATASGGTCLSPPPRPHRATLLVLVRVPSYPPPPPCVIHVCWRAASSRCAPGRADFRRGEGVQQVPVAEVCDPSFDGIPVEAIDSMHVTAWAGAYGRVRRPLPLQHMRAQPRRRSCCELLQCFAVVVDTCFTAQPASVPVCTCGRVRKALHAWRSVQLHNLVCSFIGRAEYAPLVPPALGFGNNAANACRPRQPHSRHAAQPSSTAARRRLPDLARRTVQP